MAKASGHRASIKKQKRKKVFRLKPVEAAYFAGLLDGEGCISINKHGKSYQLAVRIEMKDEGAIKFLASKTKLLGAKVYPHCDKFGPLFRWQLTDKRALIFLEGISRYLHVKKEQAEWAMTYQALVQMGQEPKKEAFYWRLRERNRKQQRNADVCH